MSKLVIVESPAKCKKIESYLGSDYKVIASFGHLTHIAKLEDININDNFKTTYSIIQETLKLKQIEKIRTEIEKSIEVIIATDDDREGEAIGWHICQLFGLCADTTKRIIFHEITQSAIQNAIVNPKTINIELVKAQQTRQILDLLVGFKISPFLWKAISKTHDTSLSAGRCQTPALRLVYENYLDIKESSDQVVYNTTGYFTNMNLLFELNKQFTTIEDCKTFLEQCKMWQFICNVTAPKKTIKKAPEPLTTSNLQQLASNELHMSPKDTMKYAQQLYEAGLITYMRTDSKKYSPEFVNNVKTYIRDYYGEQYISQVIDNISDNNTSKYSDKTNKTNKTSKTNKTDKSFAQEAHEAIRPVNINVSTPCLEDSIVDLQAKSIKLYQLIWTHTLQTCMPSAQYNSISAKITAPFDTEFIYRTEQVIFHGWQIVKQKDSKMVDTYYQYISNLKPDLVVPLKHVDSKFTLTGLKSHFSEAKLVQLLEEKGIGRPSTFASLVDKIQERKYVEKKNITGQTIECTDLTLTNNVITETIVTKEFGNEKNKLVIQPLGIIVIEFLLEKFERFFNYTYTKHMEDNLDLIAKGETDLINTCASCYNELTSILDKYQGLQKLSIKIDDEHTLIIGKHGPVVKCVSKKDPKNVSFLPVKKNLDIQDLNHIPNITLAHVIDNTVVQENNNSIGKYKGLDLFIKKGKFGIYAQWGKETKSLKEEFSMVPIDKIEYIDVVKFLDRDTLLDPSKPVGFVREINKNLSIRTGKWGDYIFYKKLRVKTPQFFKLNGFEHDYKKCDKKLLMDWIKQTYNID
jgi:DNA topoisomerase-1